MILIVSSRLPDCFLFRYRRRVKTKHRSTRSTFFSTFWAKGNTITLFFCFLLSCSTSFKNICVFFLLFRQPSCMKAPSVLGILYYGEMGSLNCWETGSFVVVAHLSKGEHSLHQWRICPLTFFWRSITQPVLWMCSTQPIHKKYNNLFWQFMIMLQPCDFHGNQG